MKLLDAINLVLPKLGERPVTSLGVPHPTLAIVLPIITNARRVALARGWWFNELKYTAFRDAAGLIALGTDTLSFLPEQYGVAIVRGGKLYNPETLTYVFTQDIKGVVIQDVPFDDLPETAASYVFYSGLIDAYTTDTGVTNELQVWQSLAARAWSDLLAEHLRQRRHSTRNTRSWRALTSALRG